MRTLLQHMCTKVTDKAEYRTKVAQAVVTIAQDLPDENYSKMVQWFYLLSKHDRVTILIPLQPCGGWSVVQRCRVSYITRASNWHIVGHPAILVAGKGRGGMFLFLLFLHFHSCSTFVPFLSSPVLSLLSLFSLSLGDDTK